MAKVEYHVNLKEVQSDRVLGPLVAEGGPAKAPFDRLAWWRLLELYCTLPPLMVVAREGNHAAMMMFQRGRDELFALSNWYTFRLRPIISEDADAVALISAIGKSLARRTTRLHIPGVPNEDKSADILMQGFRQSGWVVIREASDINHILEVAGRSFAAYLEGRPGALRTTLKRKAGKVHTIVTDRFDDGVWDAYEAIYNDSWKPREGSPAFLRAFAKAEADAGRMRFGMAFVDERPVAAQFWTVEAGTAFIHKLAHVEEAKPLSPGTVLTAALLEHVIDKDRVELVDFGTGDDPYKRTWMETSRPRYTLTMYRANDLGNWPLILVARARIAKAKRATSRQSAGEKAAAKSRRGLFSRLAPRAKRG